MQFPCFLTYVIQRAVFENRFQDCVRFSAKILHRSLCCCTVNSLHWHSKVQIWNHPNAWTCTIQVLIQLIIFFKIPLTLSGYWNHLSSGMKSMFVSTQNNDCRWNTANEFVTSSCEMNIVRRAISLIKFIHLVIWHCANAISKLTKPIFRFNSYSSIE